MHDFVPIPAVLIGNTLVVGAPNSDRLLPRAFSVGTAFVYTRPDASSDFILEQNLTQPTIKADDRFGTAVAVSDGVIYVSAPGHENGAVTDHGSIFAFVRGSTGKYALVATLFDSDAGASDQFGSTHTSTPSD
jgi:hypothetical protein